MAETDQPLPPEFWKAVEEFNRQAFFECHETLEDLWRQSDSPIQKLFYQGLLQVGVGFYHLLRQNFTGAQSLLTSGLNKLESLDQEPFAHNHIHLKQLILETHQVRDALSKLGPAHINKFPPHHLPQLR